ncbi:hypothetical protein CROQUDRAFT_102194 [Cronartium quercuum f. sp. fusiforme G11]|uniref:Uncharacterized protein n=1 Tax=Cronartium quercuum f. sp. fusiforme G11 TaxID=708437 RepID=A0A9P6N4X3_9BASI|nr:hypothetical protein CROQUDRAFT_102194 [Cronartium quercuum f. sp. fusiforme G11]
MDKRTQDMFGDGKYGQGAYSSYAKLQPKPEKHLSAPLYLETITAIQLDHELDAYFSCLSGSFAEACVYTTVGRPRSELPAALLQPSLPKLGALPSGANLPMIRILERAAFFCALFSLTASACLHLSTRSSATALVCSLLGKAHGSLNSPRLTLAGWNLPNGGSTTHSALIAGTHSAQGSQRPQTGHANMAGPFVPFSATLASKRALLVAAHLDWAILAVSRATPTSASLFRLLAEALSAETEPTAKDAGLDIS